MKIIEVVGGLYTQIPTMEYRLLKAIKKKGLVKVKIDTLTEKQKVLANSLVEYHVLDKDNEYYYVREVYLNDES